LSTDQSISFSSSEIEAKELQTIPIGFAEPSVDFPVMTLIPVAQLDIAERNNSFVTSP
jgi:hypothetical protein